MELVKLARQWNKTIFYIKISAYDRERGLLFRFTMKKTVIIRKTAKKAKRSYWNLFSKQPPALQGFFIMGYKPCTALCPAHMPLFL